MKQNILPHPYVMLVLAPIIWASSNVIGKLARGVITPFELTCYRWLLAVLVLSWFGRKVIRTDWSVLKKRWLYLLLMGGFSFGLFNIILYSAFQIGAQVINVSIITALIPVGVLLINVLVFRERAHFAQWLGVLCAFIGVCVVLSRGDLSQLLQLNFARGDSLALLSTAIYIVYSVALRYAPKVHWLSLLWAMCVGGLLASLPFYAYGVNQGALSNFSWQSVAMVAYAAVVISIISKLFYMESVLQIGASRAALTMNFLPVFGALMGVAVFADEQLANYHVLSLLLVFSGIATSEYGAYRQQRRLSIA
ncbi:DMT family transporter [Suttonella sp. R2A3]|uniref:DMT family transporter n=1 Tax=Suttonella sp. R2A3 TaxID=2908648 RepID=UPI001F2390FF|nr:DMT family transporter [Suttonella sp. R2A3]UJF25197.1 DMT family transporter [Suttonella sp. R2A3]